MRLSAFAVVVAASSAPGAAQYHAHERPRQAAVSPSVLAQRKTSAPANVRFNGFLSVQVNVDALGQNILGDAGNEPSIVVDPTDPARMAIGWREFASVSSDFREAGWAWSADSGRSWTAPGVLDPGAFRTDPVLEADGNGGFYYHSLDFGNTPYSCSVFKSADGGQNWGSGVYAYGGDKAWLAIDRTGGSGDGNIYAAWDNAGCCGDNWFNRSRDGAQSFETPVPVPEQPIYGVTAMGPAGEVYVAGRRLSTPAEFVVAKSSTPWLPATAPVFDLAVPVDLGGSQVYYLGFGPNPGGLLGQVWVDVDRSSAATRGNVYVLCSVDPPGVDPLDVHVVRSSDGGQSWSAPVRVNDDPPAASAYQWFGTLSVAPQGRLDVVWNDTRGDPAGLLSQLHYAYSLDAGQSWTPGLAVAPAFDPHLGWPNQNKLGDYYDMVSDATGIDLAYAATYNGEQDIYYLRIDCASSVPGNLDRNSFKLVKPNPLVSCSTGQLSGHWRELAVPVVESYQVHEIVGFSSRSMIANPFPGVAFAATTGQVEICYVPSPVAVGDVGYFAVFQVNECSGASRADP